MPMPTEMVLSPAGRQFLCNEEGRRPFIYDDKDGHGGVMWRPGTKIKGTLTFGVGHVVRPGDPWKPGVTYTDKDIDEQLDKDLQWVYKAIRHGIKVPISQAMFDMLCSLVTNIGDGRGIKGLPGYKPGFSNSTLKARINARASKTEIIEAWRRWRFSDGVPMLLQRRIRETNRAFLGQP